jgi:general secretion pathway protein G
VKKLKEQRNAPGFTLIELLVVIAIIAILAAILFPVFVTAKETTKTRVCSSNLRQISTAVQNYTSDWNDTFPRACDSEDRHDTPSVFAGVPLLWDAINPYVKNKKIWKCPGDVGFMWVYVPPYDTVKNAYKELGSSYSWRIGLSYYTEGDRSGAPRRVQVSQIRYPQRCVMCMDIYQYSSTLTQAQGNGGWHVRKPPLGSWNVVFTDGHTTNMLQTDVNAPKDLKVNCAKRLFCNYYVSGKCERGSNY